jgi:carboxyl-terminal processing protease
MNRFIFRSFLAAAFLFNSIGASEQELLGTKDITKIMQQIFDQHLDKKEISTEILKKSLKIYIQQFDPEKIYLLQSEVDPFLEPSQSNLDRDILEYKKDSFPFFKQLNDTIQKAIVRSRNERALLEAKKEALLQESKSIKSDQIKGFSNHHFAKNIEEIRTRLKELTFVYFYEAKRRYGDNFVQRHENKILNLLEKNLRHHEDEYLYVDEHDQVLSEKEQDHLFAMHVLKALASSLDAHTAFYDSSEAYDLKVRLEKELDGVGLMLKEGTKGYEVIRLIKGGPADKTGQIKLHDQLTEIDGHSVENEELEKVMEMLRGKAGSTVNLVLLRKVYEEGKTTEKRIEVSLQRAQMTLSENRVDVSYEDVGNGIIGKITLHSFYQNDNGISSEKDVREAIKKLDHEGNLRGLILDLRENTGGFLTQAVKVAGLFITNGVVVISKYSNGEQKIYRDMDGKIAYAGPLIVLTSKETASAAEIVAQTLQDYGVAIIVGDEHTYGKGTIQSQTVTGNQTTSLFKVTVGEYYTVSGNTPQVQGVKADVIVPSQFSRERIGEEYVDHPLPPGKISPEFNDKLTDIDPKLKGWYLRYYIPTLQRKVNLWKNMVPNLKKNSEYRIAHNKNYQMFLKQLNGESDSSEKEDFDDEFAAFRKVKNFGAEDLQMNEAVNILKDMVYLHSSNLPDASSVADHFEHHPAN